MWTGRGIVSEANGLTSLCASIVCVDESCLDVHLLLLFVSRSGMLEEGLVVGAEFDADR